MNKLDAIKRMIAEQKRLCVGFSGGVDSTLLLKAAADALGPANVLAVVADGPMLPRDELAEAVKLAEQFGVSLIVLPVKPLSIPEFANNRPDRCYHCKKMIFTAIKQEAERFGAVAADGKNADDETGYRPGQKATAELGVMSPLCEAGLTKADIRQLSRELKLATADKPANACLATRLPPDTLLDENLLKLVENAEGVLKRHGFNGGRARLHGEMLRLELQKEQLAKAVLDKTITGELKALGFRFVTLDLEGFRSGSMD